MNSKKGHKKYLSIANNLKNLKYSSFLYSLIEAFLVAFIMCDLSISRLYFSINLLQLAPLDLASRLLELTPGPGKLGWIGNAVFFNFPLLMMYLQQKQTLGWFNIKYIKPNFRSLRMLMEDSWSFKENTPKKVLYSFSLSNQRKGLLQISQTKKLLDQENFSVFCLNQVEITLLSGWNLLRENLLGKFFLFILNFNSFNGLWSFILCTCST